MDNKSTGDLIKKLRTDKGLTQQQLADRLSVTTAAVSKWERGKGFPDVSLLEELANELGVSISELVKGKMMQEEESSNNDELIKQVVKESGRQYGSKLNYLKILLIIILVVGIWFVCDHAIVGRTMAPQIINFEFADTGSVYLHVWNPKLLKHNYQGLKSVQTEEKDHTLYIRCKFVDWSLFFRQNEKAVQVETDGDLKKIVVYGTNNKEITIYENGLIISPQARVLASEPHDEMLILEYCTDSDLGDMISPLDLTNDNSEIIISNGVLHINIKKEFTMEQGLIETKLSRYSSMVMAMLKDLKGTEITYPDIDGNTHLFSFTRQQAEQFVGIGLFCEFEPTPYQIQRLLNALNIKNPALGSTPEINVRIPVKE